MCAYLLIIIVYLGNSLLAEQLVASQGGLSSMQLVSI
jgi:hypothetical protein